MKKNGDLLYASNVFITCKETCLKHRLTSCEVGVWSGGWKVDK